MISRVRSLFLSNPSSPRALQELHDVSKCILLSRFRSLRLASATPAASEAASSGLLTVAAEACEKDLEGRSLHEHRNAVAKELAGQSSAILEALHLARGDERSLESRLGFRLVKDTSRIIGAGNGLFLKGGALAGAMVAYFPGVVHLREHLRDAKSMDQFSEDPNFLILSRYDDIIIDCRENFGKSVKDNAYALAHLANHPPLGTSPNVMQLMFDFPSPPGPEYERHIPNRYFKPPTLLGTIDRSAVMQGMALVATRDLKDGEELLINYRLNPKSGKRPAWYSPCDEEEEKRRWGA